MSSNELCHALETQSSILDLNYVVHEKRQLVIGVKTSEPI